MKVLSFTTILQRYRDVLAASDAIEAWCQGKYQKPLTIMVGVNPGAPPNESDCPVFFMTEIHKAEGDGSESFTYMLSAFASVYTDSAPMTTDNVIEYAGVYDVDELGHLIIQELAAASDVAQIENVDVSLEAFRYPQYTIRMDIMFEIPHTIGGSDTINF
jgi:hypothetical protein